ncbi:MAG TPA: hypothetical protein VJM32_03685 [Candidatus Saccharimonadales bacterium]|nr:hypothetical protein [Candidatus Saccharimonadales bacterium]
MFFRGSGRRPPPSPFPSTELGKAIFDTAVRLRRNRAWLDREVTYLYPGDVVEYVSWHGPEMDGWRLTQNLVEEESAMVARQDTSDMHTRMGESSPGLSEMSTYYRWGMTSHMDPGSIRALRVIRLITPMAVAASQPPPQALRA